MAHVRPWMFNKEVLETPMSSWEGVVGSREIVFKVNGENEKGVPGLESAGHSMLLTASITVMLFIFA